jgi:hypothetical protein
MRWPLEVFAAVRAVWPQDKPMSVRLSATDWIQGGLSGSDSVEIARAFAAAGCDLIDVSTGQTDPASRPVYGRMYQASFAEQIRLEADIATMAVGAVTSADQVNTLLISGRADLVALARARPGQLTYSSGGPGNLAHLGFEMINNRAGIKTTHVPYNQFGMAIGDLIADRTNFMFLTASAAIPQIQGGKLKAMAVTGAKRLPALKEVPTMAEQGFADFVLRSFDGMMVKVGTPKEVVERLNTELNKALNLPEVRERLGALALETEPMSGGQFGAVIAAETEKWQRIGRAAQIKAD